MKKMQKESFVAFALVALAVPVTLLGVAAVSAASGLRDVQSMHFELFDADEFRQLQREVHADTPDAVTEEDEMETETLNPCDPVQEARPVKEEEKPLLYQDLSSTEREALRIQLRIGGCPTDVLPGYKALCERLLKYQVQRETMEGLKSPQQ